MDVTPEYMDVTKRTKTAVTSKTKYIRSAVSGCIYMVLSGVTLRETCAGFILYG